MGEAILARATGGGGGAKIAYGSIKGNSSPSLVIENVDFIPTHAIIFHPKDTTGYYYGIHTVVYNPTTNIVRYAQYGDPYTKSDCVSFSLSGTSLTVNSGLSSTFQFYYESTYYYLLTSE